MASGKGGGSETHSQSQVFGSWQEGGVDKDEVTSKASQGPSPSGLQDSPEFIPSSPIPLPGKSGEDDPSPQDSRPTDEEIVRQQNTIMEEQVRDSPLVGPIEPLSGREEEYKNGNDVFVQKLQFLQKEYSGLRRVRRDGNCFFRGFIFGYVESLLTDENYQERDRMTKHLDSCKEKLLKARFQDLVFEDALNIVQEKVSEVGHPTKDLTLPVWELVMKDEQISNYIVMFLRLLTSAEIQLNKDTFLPFIMGISDIMDVELFCQRMVEVMNEESEEIHIKALTDALMVPIRVYSVASLGKIELSPTDYIPENSPSDQPLVHLLYTPGHYDILYLKDRT